MTAEFPSPDDRLPGKVKIVEFSAQRDVLWVPSKNDSGVTAALAPGYVVP